MALETRRGWLGLFIGAGGDGRKKIRELLTFYKFNGDDIPLVAGSALAAVEGRDKEVGADAIMELMDAVDSHIPTPARGAAISPLPPPPPLHIHYAKFDIIFSPNLNTFFW